MKKLSLYDITSAFPRLVEEETISDEDKQKIAEELATLLKQKSSQIIKYIRNIELTINAMKEEENRIYGDRKTLENKLKSFKNYVKECMLQNNLKKIQTEIGTVSIAKSPVSIEILDENKVPSKYKQEETKIKIDKKAIANDFKSTGEIVEGTEVHANNTSLRIK